VWDFGDGTTSKLATTTHNYSTAGTFIVTLTTYKGNCTETRKKSMPLLSIGLNDVSTTPRPKVYPNPFSDKVIIENSHEKEISIYNILGQDYGNSISLTITPKGVEINTSNLPKGVYLFKSKSFTYKLYKQ
jgi:PKD repeat protein